MDRLPEQEIEAALATLKDWRRDGREVARRYGFASFPEAVAFVNGVAAMAEERRHHPFISIDYRHVTLRLTTWNAGGLTALDFALARQFDGLFEAARAGGDAP